MPSSTKTKQCPCGAKSGRDENGKSIHPLSVDDVWFDELELGSEFKLVALTYRHFTNTHGFMGKLFVFKRVGKSMCLSVCKSLNMFEEGRVLYCCVSCTCLNVLVFNVIECVPRILNHI